MRKILLSAVILALIACMPAFASLPVGLEITPSPEDYANTDLSQFKTVTMYLVGDGADTYPDFPEILDMINERLVPYNTKLDVNVISWSDAGNKYPLILSGGEDADLIFVATWRNLWTGAADESFYTLDWDFIEKYMPYTFQYQPKESFNEVTYNGKIEAVTQNRTPSSPSLIGYRTDLAAKYGFEKEIKTWDDLKEYLLLVAAHTEETGMFGYNAGSTDLLVQNQVTRQFDLASVARTGYFRFVYGDGTIPKPEDVTFYYTSDYYKWMLSQAKELCDAGVWSRSALSKTETAAQSFQNGTGATISWNYTVFQYMNYLEETVLHVNRGDVTAATILNYDLYANDVEGYNNNAMAILAATKDPYRAAMVLDLLKYDTTINTWICKGVEGRHFVYDEDMVPVEGPEVADYRPGGMSWCWATQNDNFNEYFSREDNKYWFTVATSNNAVNPTNAFVFDKEPVNAFAAAIDASVTEYQYTLGLGLFDDADSALANFLDQLERSGLETYINEYKTQYETWYNGLGL